MEARFIVRTDNLLIGGAVLSRGQMVTREELRGADLNFLLSSGAVEIVGDESSVILLPDDPSPEDYQFEIGRLQRVVEKQAQVIDELRAEQTRSREAAEARPAAPPGPTPRERELQESLDAANRNIDSIARQRESVRQRADSYAARVSHLESLVKAHGLEAGEPEGTSPPPDHTGSTGTTANPADQFAGPGTTGGHGTPVRRGRR